MSLHGFSGGSSRSSNFGLAWETPIIGLDVVTQPVSDGADETIAEIAHRLASTSGDTDRVLPIFRWYLPTIHTLELIEESSGQSGFVFGPSASDHF